MLKFLSSIPPATAGWMLILGGCCANVMSLEFITTRDKSAGNLITFAQFLYISCEGFLSQFDFRTGKLTERKIPLLTYTFLTLPFLVASVLNNLALNFNISMPVHTVFRSSGLFGTLLTGWMFFGKRYSPMQIGSSLVICFGIIALTLADGQARKLQGCCGDGLEATGITTATVTEASSNSSAVIPDLFSSLPFLGLGPLITSLLSGLDFRWLIGIGMLTSTLFMLALLGHVQERTYAKYGKVWREVMFYTHFFSLPFFLAGWDSILSTLVTWWPKESWPTVSLIGWNIAAPMYIFLLINLITQSICFKGVAILTSHTSALTTTIALTIRKVLSLLLSIVYFGNAFTTHHWIGTFLVFGGILAYANEERLNKAKQAAAAATTTAAISAAKSDSSSESIEDWLKRRGIALKDSSPSPSPLLSPNIPISSQHSWEQRGYIVAPSSSSSATSESNVRSIDEPSTTDESILRPRRGKSNTSTPLDADASPVPTRSISKKNSSHTQTHTNSTSSSKKKRANKR